MQTLFVLFTRLWCSVDISLGILIYVTISLFFGQSFSPWVLLFALFCSHLPDADFVPFLLFRKKFGAIGNHEAGGHWPYGHHPLLVVPGAAAIAYFVAGHYWPGVGIYVGTITLTGVTAHFIHDSVQGQGLHWFSPLSWTHYTLANGFPRKVSDDFVRKFYRELSAESTKKDNATYEFISRVASLTRREWQLFIGALSFLVLYVFVDTILTP